MSGSESGSCQSKYSFKDDYSEGCHEDILRALHESNSIQQLSYGQDEFCEKARAAIRTHLGNADASVFFFSTGTLTNIVALPSLLKSYESIIATQEAHIHTHETGGIEVHGRKIHLVDCRETDGKVNASQVLKVLEQHSGCHMVKPRLVYVSNSTEMGTVYSRKELQQLKAVCKEEGLLLYLDGARLGAALASEQSDIEFADLAELVDCFYIGGTKNGALCGEALVFNDPKMCENFEFVMKQNGALMSKGRLLGVQFLELFKGDLYFRLAAKANKNAQRLAKGIEELGFELWSPCASNQVFPVLPKRLVELLSKSFGFYEWEKVDDESMAIRLVTSWATPEAAVDEFLDKLKGLAKYIGHGAQ